MRVEVRSSGDGQGSTPLVQHTASHAVVKSYPSAAVSNHTWHLVKGRPHAVCTGRPPGSGFNAGVAAVRNDTCQRKLRSELTGTVDTVSSCVRGSCLCRVEPCEHVRGCRNRVSGPCATRGATGHVVGGLRWSWLFKQPSSRAWKGALRTHAELQQGCVQGRGNDERNSFRPGGLSRVSAPRLRNRILLPIT